MITPEQEKKILKENPRKLVRFGTIEDMIDQKHLVKDPEYENHSYDEVDLYLTIDYLIKLLTEAKEAGAKYIGEWGCSEIDMYYEERESEYRARINTIKADLGLKYQEEAKIQDLNLPKWKERRLIELKNQLEILDFSEEAWEVLKGEKDFILQK